MFWNQIKDVFKRRLYETLAEIEEGLWNGITNKFVNEISLFSIFAWLIFSQKAK